MLVVCSARFEAVCWKQIGCVAVRSANASLHTVADSKKKKINKYSLLKISSYFNINQRAIISDVDCWYFSCILTGNYLCDFPFLKIHLVFKKRKMFDIIWYRAFNWINNYEITAYSSLKKTGRGSSCNQLETSAGLLKVYLHSRGKEKQKVLLFSL